MASAADLRRVALSFEGVTEAPHFDRAAFRAARIFVTLAADGRTANFKFTPDQQEFKCTLAPEVFTPVPGGWGRMGYTTAILERLGEAELRDALGLAYGNAAPRAKTSRKGAAKSAPGKAALSQPAQKPAGKK